MKQTVGAKNNVTKQSAKSGTLSKSPPQKSVSSKKESPSKSLSKGAKYKIDAVTKDNFQISQQKLNITEIGELPLKYVLRCIDGLYKNRYIFITTHPQGEIFGSGDVKLYGLTLQIQGVGLSPKHAQLKYDGFKSFNVIDFGSENGTWMNIPQEGVQIKDGEHYSIGPYMASFNFAEDINEIQQICMVYHVTYLSDVLEYNGIHTLSQLYAANYNNFEGYPFEKKEIEKLKRICQQTKNWYEQGKKYKRLHINYLNQPLKDLSIEIGWETFSVNSDPQFLFHGKNFVAEITKGRIVPIEKVFSRIKQGKFMPLSLHSQVKFGNLSFQMTRFNVGVGEDIGFRPLMEDGLVIEEDVGGSQWKLISLFAVFDGHGGPQCMKYMKENLLSKIRQWTNLLDQAGDLNEMVKVLMNKTFFELDYEFYKKYPELSMACGCTALVMLVIESKVYTFHVGDCKSYLFRNQVLYKMNIDHLPVNKILYRAEEMKETGYKMLEDLCSMID